MADLALRAPTKEAPPFPMLAVIGEIAIPPAVLKHRFYLEALAGTMVRSKHDEDDGANRVVGTANTKQAELYGWAPNVGKHIDDTGYVYVVPLAVDFSVLYAKHLGDLHELRLRAGQVVRLWDFAPHWTEDRAGVVAAFAGSFPAPCDSEALQLLQAGIDLLASGAYYGAPRVIPGFRAPLPDECLATTDFENYEWMLRADLRRRRAHMLRCGTCDAPAVRLDHHWPNFSDNNLCRRHLRAEVSS